MLRSFEEFQMWNNYLLWNTLLDMEVSNVLKVSIASPVIDDIFLTPEMFGKVIYNLD